MKRVAALALLLLAAPAVWGQSVKLPAKASGKVSAWIIIPIETLDGGDVRWYLPDAKKANGERAHEAYEADPTQGLAEVPLEALFGSEWATKAHGRVFTSDVAGQFRVVAYCAKGDKSSLISVCTVTVGEPPPGPTPGPIPPGPTPPTPGPVANLRVLVTYDANTVTKLPAGQQSVLYSKAVRDALDAATPAGPDGKTHQWRMWAEGTDATGEGNGWAELMKRTHAAGPWIIFAGESGVAYEGPLPAAVPEMLALIQKYAPKSLRKAG